MAEAETESKAAATTSIKPKAALLAAAPENASSESAVVGSTEAPIKSSIATRGKTPTNKATASEVEVEPTKTRRDIEIPEESSANNKDVQELNKLLEQIGAKQQSGHEETVWEYAVNEAKKKKVKKDEIRTALFMGNKSAGKTSLILSFLERNETPKPTFALDFNFARRQTHDMTTEVCHIWELGGELTDPYHADLMDVPIVNCHELDKLALFLILDLSEPKKIWPALETAVLQIKKAVRQALMELDKSEVPGITQKLEKNLTKRIGAAMQEKEFLDPLPLPLAIIGTKYDQFQNSDPEIRKIVCRVLRLAAHRLGASLNFYSKEDPVLKRRFREIFSHYAFKTSFPKATSYDFNAALMIPPGGDSFEAICPDQKPSQFTLEYCRHLFQTKIGRPEEQPKTIYDPATDPKYAEPEFDRKRQEFFDRLAKQAKIKDDFADQPNQVI